jgi:hypothetical protein
MFNSFTPGDKCWFVLDVNRIIQNCINDFEFYTRLSKHELVEPKDQQTFLSYAVEASNIRQQLEFFTEQLVKLPCKLLSTTWGLYEVQYTLMDGDHTIFTDFIWAYPGDAQNYINSLLNNPLQTTPDNDV